MKILKVGLNYRKTPIEMRERFTFSPNTVKKAMLTLNKEKNILENVILSTCNRTEIYVVVDQLELGKKQVKNFLREWFNININKYSSYIQYVTDEEVVAHLFRLAIGLDSMILGETQILGQVRHSFSIAQEINTTGVIFNELFKRAITFAKKAHRKTAIGEHAVSISYAAVQLLREEVNDFSNKKGLVIGAGKMGSLALRNLVGSGCLNVTVINRTKERAKKLAQQIKSIQWQPYEKMISLIESVDFILTSTSSAEPILTKDLLKNIQTLRKNRPLHIVDIAVPRDVSSDVLELKNIYLYDVDSLESIVDQNLEKRKQIAEEIEKHIVVEIDSFYKWLQIVYVVPTISALQHKATSIQEEVYLSIKRKLSNLSNREQEVLKSHTKSIVNQMLKDPLRKIKEISTSEERKEKLALFIEIFGLEEEVKKDIMKRQKEDKYKSVLNEQIKQLPFTIIEKQDN